MRNNFSGSLAVAVALLFIGVLYIFNLQNYANTLRSTEYPVDDLEAALRKAAAGNNKTVIITMVNKAYVEDVGRGRTMLDLFLESFWEGQGTRPLLDHLMVVTADQTAYDRCRFKRLHCYKMETDGLDLEEEKIFMSKGFIEMMWQRTRLLLDVLRRGYHVIFTDTDVMWLRNPLSQLNVSLDMQISVDSTFRGGHLINTGFYHVRSNNKTISLFRQWYDMRLNSTGMKEQDVLKNLLDSGYFDQLGLSVGLLNTNEFSGFCQDSSDMGAVTTVHANCCRHISAKVFDLTRVLRDWKRYKASHVNSKWSPHVMCGRSWNDTYIPNL
ncbi:hypothetical protein CARUB_v10012005mg [Capsella rubella]|uniref:Glycosyltransferase n=1 Tax=Capsella rubella TaxID=81985 RepID=R0I5Q6_9BRAS|nr:uncharacterized protein At1g28695 [Capsella rubella]EOA37614.1 hypothetical protein CARUB_v10012005mg [Capsella rubella]